MPDDVPLPLLLAQNLVTQAVAYLAVTGVLFAVFFRLGRAWFQRRTRIPQVDRVDGSQLRRELGYTMVTFVMGTFSAGGVITLKATGHAALPDDVSAPLVLAWIGGLLVWNDLWFYSWHRLLHHPRLFRWVHAVHHKSVDVNPFTSYSFCGVEALLLGAWIVPAVAFLPVPLAAIGALQVIGLLNNVMSHLGHELLPRWLMRVPLLRLTNTATFHSLHHTHMNGNYGLHSRVWDRLFGTEVEGYEEVFLARGTALTGAVAPPRVTS